MDAFDVGSHVLIELEDDRKIAGYIMGVNEDGMLLKATHREQAITSYLSVATSESIRSQLQEKATLHLRWAMVLNGFVLQVAAKRDEMVESLAGLIEEKLREGVETKMQFRELANPVLTFVNSGYIKIMEDTDDKVAEAEISIFDQTLEAGFYAVLDEADAKKAAEADGVVEPTEE